MYITTKLFFKKIEPVYALYIDDIKYDMTTTQKKEEYDTLMAHIRGTAIYRFVSNNKRLKCRLLDGYVSENELYDLFPNMPNVDMELLRNWWVLYNPIMEELSGHETSFGYENSRDEPNDTELFFIFVFNCDYIKNN